MFVASNDLYIDPKYMVVNTLLSLLCFLFEAAWTCITRNKGGSLMWLMPQETTRLLIPH